MTNAYNSATFFVPVAFGKDKDVFAVDGVSTNHS